MGRKLIFSQVIPASDFSLNTDFGALAAYRYENDTPLAVGETYIVSWDGQEYECVAQDGDTVYPTLVFIGNAQPVGLAGNSEPFIIGQTAQIPLNFFSLTDTQPTQHSVEIYQLVEDVEPDTPDEPAETPDGIVIHNPLGQRVVYGEYKKIRINRASGAQTIFSMGDAEETTVELDFSKGNMAVIPEKETLFSKVNIPQPENLIAENIKKDVVVAGITGTLTADNDAGDVIELEETDISFFESSGTYQGVLPITRLFLNATYTVVWNGTEYSCTCKTMEFADSLILTVGNAALLGGEASNEPFVIAQIGDVIGCLTMETNVTNTVGLTLNFEAGGDSGEKPTLISKIATTSTSTTTDTVLITADEFSEAGIDCTVTNFFAMILSTKYYGGSKNNNILNMAAMANKAFIRNSSTTRYGVYVYSNVYSTSSHTLKVDSMSNVSLTNSGNTGVLYISDNNLHLKASGYTLTGSYYVIAGYIN